MAIPVSTFPVEQHVFDILLYPQQHPNNAIWVQNNLQHVNFELTQAGAEHMAYLMQMNKQLNDESALRNARNVLREIQSIVVPNVIFPLLTPGHLQNAPPIMQRYIMACPEIRQEYQQGRLDWYNDTYVDDDPDTIGENHYDYRKAVSGIVQDDASYMVDLEEMRPGDQELTLREQTDISVTWEFVKECLVQSYDPLKKYNS